jgi:hypothetical protein
MLLALFALIDRRVSIERLPKSWDRLPTNDGAGNNTRERRHNWPFATTGVSSVPLYIDPRTTGTGENICSCLISYSECYETRRCFIATAFER